MVPSAAACVVETDALVIGAGPVGLYQAFQLGLLEVRTHLIDALAHAGGQCIELYADKPIYDIPGIPVCTGRQLVDNLLQQVAPFAPEFHFSQLVSGFERTDDGQFLTRTSTGLQLRSKAVFIAAGVGAFQPRCPSIDGLRSFAGRQLHFQLPPSANTQGAHVLILGDTDSALQAALDLCNTTGPHADPTSRPASITLIHRREVFQADPATEAAFRAQVASGAIRFMAAQPTTIHAQEERLHSVTVADNLGTLHTLNVDCMLVLQGLSPQLGPIANWGLAMERRQLRVNTETFATDLPGVFAVGDINSYPGKKRLMACGFHEAILAAFGAMPHIAPQRRVQLQYTSSSAHLQQLLGVPDTTHPASGTGAHQTSSLVNAPFSKQAKN